MQVEGLDTTIKLDAAVVNYINKLKIQNKNYEYQIQTLKTNHEQQVQDLTHQIHNIKNESIEYYNKYIYYKDQYTLLTFKRFGRSAEQIPYDSNQPLLFSGEAEPEFEPEEAIEEEKTEVKSYTRSKRGRKPINPALPVKRIEIEIPENERICACGSIMAKIGEETSKRLALIPMEIYVEETARFKYACRNCEGTEDEDTPAVRIAPLPPSMIPRSITTPSLLATVFTNKFVDHLPYERQEKMFDRIEIDISKQNMSNWQQKVYEKLEPLLDLMKRTVKSGPVLQEDETSVQVMSGIKTKKEDKKPEDRKPDIHKGWMWVARGGPADKKTIWYEYHESRGKKYVEEFLKGYKGYLQTDGYKAYDSVVKYNPDIIHVGCFAHARRKFFEASKITKNNKSAGEGIKHIRKLYELESKLREEKKKREETENKMSEEEFVEKRKTEAIPILEKFKSWLLKRKDEINPTSPMGEAVNYTLKKWDNLSAYLGSYHLTPDNNACENAIRPFVVGRKNWMIAGSPEGIKSSCGLYSLIETAKQHNKEPYKYLKTLFEKAPHASTPEDWEKLTPWNISIK